MTETAPDAHFLAACPVNNYSQALIMVETDSSVE